jgi:hypothetical protein
MLGFIPNQLLRLSLFLFLLPWRFGQFSGHGLPAHLPPTLSLPFCSLSDPYLEQIYDAPPNSMLPSFSRPWVSSLRPAMFHYAARGYICNFVHTIKSGMPLTAILNVRQAKQPAITGVALSHKTLHDHALGFPTAPLPPKYPPVSFLGILIHLH